MKQYILAQWVYNPKNEIVVTADSSAYGIGAILTINGELFASCTLNEAERNYAQVEKEALALIFAVKRFHKVFGQKFTLVSDHLPLRTIFGPKNSFPTMAHSRLQRWAIILSVYDYKIVYKRGIEISNANCLSRLPLPHVKSEVEEVKSSTSFQELPLTAEDILDETQRDQILAKVLV